MRAKIEKAVSKIEGIQTVQVLFATEKLLVNFNQPANAEQIEQACQNAGFSIKNLNEASVENSSAKPSNLIRDNLQIISISVAMLVGVITKILSPEMSEWIFILTCLLGLLPIGKKPFNWQDLVHLCYRNLNDRCCFRGALFR